MSVPEKVDDLDIAASPTRSQPLVNGARRSGVEVLKPLASSEHLTKQKTTADSRFPGLDHLSWFQLSLAVGSAVVAAALILSSFFIWTDADASTHDVAINEQPIIGRTPPKKEGPFVPFAVKSTPGLADEPAYVEKRSPVLRPAVRAAYHPRRLSRRPQLVVSKFVPTTLIIYTENGSVKTRSEPQLTAAYKKQASLRD